MANEEDKQLTYVDDRLSDMKTNFRIYEPRYKKIRKFLAPNTGDFDRESKDDKAKNQYYKNNINTKPYYYGKTLASMLLSNFTSPAARWFSLGVENVSTTLTHEEKQYFKDSENALYKVFKNANLHTTLANVYFETINYGIGAMLIKPNKDNGIHFMPMTIGQYFVEQDSDGNVNTLARQFTMTNGELEDQFGFDALTQPIQESLKKGDISQKQTVNQLVEPNRNYLEAWESPFNRTFTSTYWLDGKVVESKGMDYFPFFVAMWDRQGTGVYPTGIGEAVLGDVGQLQAEEYDMAKARKKTLNPPMKTRSARTEVKSGAGELTVSSDLEGIQRLFEMNFDIQSTLQDVARVEDRIAKAYFFEVFFALTGIDKTMSATEAAGRTNEGLRALGGITTRMHSDFLDPIVTTSYDMLNKNARFMPVPPESLQGKELEIDYRSPLQASMETTDLSLVEQWLQLVNAIAPTDPSVVNIPNTDKIVRYAADKLSINPSLIKTTDQVDKIEAQQDEARRQAGQLDQSKALDNTASAAKKFSEAGTTGDNALAQMLEAA